VIFGAIDPDRRPQVSRLLVEYRDIRHCANASSNFTHSYLSGPLKGHRFRRISYCIDAEVSGEKHGAAGVKIISDYCEIAQTEDLTRARHRVQCPEAGVVEGESGFRHTQFEKRGLHIRGLTVTRATVVATEQEMFDLSDSIEVGGSLGADFEMRIRIQGIARRTRAEHQTDIISWQDGRVGIDARSGRT